MKIILALIFLLLAIAGVVVRKTYYHLPSRELRRRARSRDKQYEKLYRAVAYGSSLRMLLWIYIGLTSAASFILLARNLPVWLSLLVIGLLLWLVFAILPAGQVSRFGRGLTILVTPLIVWLLNYLHPLLSRASDLLTGHLKRPPHTHLYEREDLLRLIASQQAQPDNRLAPEELEIAKRALSFDDHTLADVLTPRKALKTVKPSDAIGPVLIDELHQSGQDYALVRETPKGEILGTLAFNQLGIKSSGVVRGHMDPTVYYLHVRDSLGEALHAFFVTNHPVFVVVDEAEAVLGIVTVENILRELLGHLPGDEFDQYADPAAVANRHNPKTEPEALPDAEPDSAANQA